MQDPLHGRLYRLVPKSEPDAYAIPTNDFTTPVGAVAALHSPNQATRYLAWQALQGFAAAAVDPLLEMASDESHPWFVARALWRWLRSV